MIKKMEKMLLVMAVAAIAFGTSGYADDTHKPTTVPADMHEKWMTDHPGELPIWPTPEELRRWHTIGNGFQPTAPPGGAVRNPGEFEPMEGVLIRYPLGLTYSLIKEMAKDTKVVTIVANTSTKNAAINNYQSHGINMSNCEWLIAPSDSYWTRDYGPWYIIDSNGDQGIVDTVYNRPRPNDDKIPAKYGQAYGIPVYAMDLITAGGNYMSAGQGDAASTDLTWSENPGKTKTQIHQMMLDYLGVTNYHVVKDVLGAYIKHIDCWGKFLAPDKVMIIEFPPSHSHYKDAEDAVLYWQSQASCYGTPYEVYRVYSPNGQPYTNSLSLNHKMLVPITGSSWDDDAIDSYEDALPGYTVLGFTGSWASTDALHCRTMGITDSGMLYIHHIPLQDGPPAALGFEVEAEVIAYSGGSFTGGTPALHYDAGSGWTSVAMTYTGGGDLYSAFIPPFPDGTLIKYYINAQDSTGRDENHPYIGEADAHEFYVYDPVLGADVTSISELYGGTINFSLNAGLANAGRNHVLLGSVSGTSPGTTLPGGMATLPLNWDFFSDFVLRMLNTPMFMDFYGVLDADGRAAAQANFPPHLPSGSAGYTMHYAFALDKPWDFTSNAVAVDIVN